MFRVFSVFPATGTRKIRRRPATLLLEHRLQRQVFPVFQRAPRARPRAGRRLRFEAEHQEHEP